jgi:hypothetical protein
MNHAASNVLFILAQNSLVRTGFGKNPANPSHAPSIFADEEVFKSIDTNRVCA